MFGAGRLALGLSAAILPWRPITPAQDLLDRLSTSPSRQYARQIDAVFRAIRPYGLLSVLDALHVHAGRDRQASKLNWIADAYNLTESGVDAVAFTAFRGFTPDGVATYLSSGFNPTTAVSPKFTLNSAHMMAWHLTAVTGFDMGNTNSRITRPGTASVFTRPNNVTNFTAAGTYTTHKGWNRTANNVTNMFISGAQVGAGTSAVATALLNFDFGYGRTSATEFGSSQVAAGHWGAALTTTQIAVLYAAIRRYLLAVGAILA